MSMGCMPNATNVTQLHTPAPESSPLCFLCRFDMGVTLGTLDAGLLGLLVVVCSLMCCCCVCGAVFYCCCVFSNEASRGKASGWSDYTPVGKKSSKNKANEEEDEEAAEEEEPLSRASSSPKSKSAVQGKKK